MTSNAQNMVPTSGKGLVLLRLCNELLRRLSKTHPQHTMLAGRIFLLLSSTFAISERSGVNLKGEFDTSQTIDIEAANEQCEPPSETKPEILIHHPQFYVLFWSLQRYFTNPTLLFSESEAPGARAAEALGLQERQASTPMHTFQTGIQCVLDVMRWLNKKSDSPPKTKRARFETSASSPTYPRYRCTQTLFGYELHNLAFQQQYLVQCLITFQYLLGQTSATHEQSKEWKNKLLVPMHTLKQEEEQWLRKTWRQIQTVLRESSQEGRVFLDAVLMLLRRESSWIRWKAASAPSFHKDALNPDTLQAWSDKIRTTFAQQEPWFPHALGTPELSRLWEDGFHVAEPSEMHVNDEEGHDKTIRTDGWEELEFPRAPPSLRSLCRAIEHCTNPDQAQSLSWRALRCASLEHLHVFARMRALDDIPSLVQAIDDEHNDVPYEVSIIGEEPSTEDYDNEHQHADVDAIDVDDSAEQIAPSSQGNVDNYPHSSTENQTKSSVSNIRSPEARRESPSSPPPADHSADTTPTSSYVEAAPVSQSHEDMIPTNGDDAPPSHHRERSSSLSSSSSSPLSSSVDADADATFMTAPGHDGHMT